MNFVWYLKQMMLSAEPVESNFRIVGSLDVEKVQQDGDPADGKQRICQTTGCLKHVRSCSNIGMAQD